MLADGWRNLLLAIEANQVVLDLGIDDEDWLQMVDIAPLESLSENVQFRTDGSVSYFRQLSLNLIREAAKVFNVYTSASLQVLLNVPHERLPDNQVLGLRLEWLHTALSPTGRHVVLSWVLVTVFKDPNRNTG